MFRDLKRTYTKCPNQVREDFCNYFWHLLESLEEEPGFQEFYSHDTFLTQLQTLLSDSNVIAFSFEMIPLKYLNYIDPHKHYILGISQHNEAKQILAHFIIELLGLTNVTISTKGFCQNNYDSLVVLPDIRNTLEDGIDYSNIDTQTWSLNDVFRNAKNRTIVLLNRDFCASYKTILSTYREKICKGQYIEKIIELPKETFPAIHSSASLISLNFENPSKEVCIIKKDKEIHVSYETLQKHDYILSFDLYSQEIQAAEDQDIVRICDIVDFRFDYDRRPDGYPARSLSDSDFHSTLLSTIKHRNQYTAEQSSTQIPILKEYNGEHLFLKYKDRVQLNLQTEDAFCFPDYGSYALRLKEGSPVKTLDYLAYILMSEEANQYLGKITDKNGDFIIRELMYKKVAIYTNPDKQNEVVRTTLAKERMKMDNGISYNIVVISEKKELIHYIDKIDGMSVIAKDQSYVDLYTRYIEDTNKEIIDAVVVDNDSPDYESVIEDFNEIRERDIHLYIITNDSELQLSGRKKKAYFEDNNRIYCFRSDSEKYRLIDSIREDLDSSKASQARIRSKYNDVFDAASKLDEEYKLNISETIIQYIQNGCEIENAQNTAFDKLRDVCHKLLQIFADKDVVPQILKDKPGAIASLLADGCYTHTYKNKKKWVDVTFVMVHNILDNTPGLAKALEYFCFIANKEVHGQQYSSKLGTSVLNILMEFILRFYQLDILDKKLDLLGKAGMAYIQDDDIKKQKNELSVQVSDDGKYYFVDSGVGDIGIHLQEKPGLTPGAKIKVTSNVKQETQNKREINGIHVILYIHRDGYQLIK